MMRLQPSPLKMHAHDTLVGSCGLGVVIFPKDDALDGESMWTGTLRLVTITFREEFGTRISITSMTNCNTVWPWPTGKWFRVLPRYTHLLCQDDDSDDEWSAGLSYGELPWLETAWMQLIRKMLAERFSNGRPAGIQSERRVSAIRVGHIRMERRIRIGWS